MRRSLTLVTPPALEPVNLSDAKAWARIDDESENTLLAQLIVTARMSAEEYLRRTLIDTTYKLTLNLAGNCLYDELGEGTYDLPVTALYGTFPSTVDLIKPPIRSITSVVTYDTNNTSTTFDAANYRLDTAGERLVLTTGAIWPSNLRAIGASEIIYVAGYGATAASVPMPIRTGIMMHVAALYEQRGLCDDPTSLPPATKRLYDQYRIMGDRRG